MATKKKPAPKASKPLQKKAKAQPVKKLALKSKPAKKMVAKPAAKAKPAKKAKPAPKAKPTPKAKPVAKAKPVPAKLVQVVAPPVKNVPIKLTPFLLKQRERLLILKDTLLDSMNGVAKDNLRSRAEGSEASAFGMHQADAGSDAYDRDFALSLLSQEQDSLYEINEALKRVETGAYGLCEISGKAIPHPRLEALPFTRYTVECQAELEKRNHYQGVRQPVTSLFGLTDDDGDDDDDSPTDNKE